MAFEAQVLANPSGGNGPRTQPTKHVSASTDDEQRLEVYKLLVEMADRVSQRRQANNNFYLSVNTAIVAAAAYFASNLGAQVPAFIISLAGVVICVAWGWSIQSYRTLNQAKFSVIQNVEKELAIQPFASEWRNLTGGGPTRHTPFHRVEVIVPWVFGGLHGVQLLAQIPWSALRQWLPG